MTKSEPESNVHKDYPKESRVAFGKKICNLNYLSEMMGGEKHLINEIMDVFFKQIPKELQSINHAVTKADYAIIKNFAHTMQSSVFIMGISVLIPVSQEIEDLEVKAPDIEKHKINITNS